MLQKRMEDVGQEEQEDMSNGLALSNSIMELAESLEEGETKDPCRCLNKHTFLRLVLRITYVV